MTLLQPAQSTTLTWSKLPRCQGYEVRLNNEAVGALQRPSFWKSSFLASTSRGAWIFRRKGFLNHGAEIVESSSEQPIANFRAGWCGKGTLTFSDGQQFHLQSNGCWRPVWNVTDDSGQAVLSLRVRDKVVDVPESSPLSDERIFLLTMFALYRIRVAQDEAAAAGVVAVIAAS